MNNSVTVKQAYKINFVKQKQLIKYGGKFIFIKCSGTLKVHNEKQRKMKY